jgi:hypothetical protein
MLRVLFLLVTILSDYRAVADMLESGFHFALINTGLLLMLGSFQVIRRFVPSRNRVAPSNRHHSG